MGGAGKRKRDTLEDILARPWCYYCLRDFNDDAVLQEHQRQQHFHCHEPTCSRKLNTASGLTVHMQQVHKLTLTTIFNTIDGRESPGIEIFGMVGVPDDLIKARKDAIQHEWYKRAADYKAKTGNPLPGTVTYDQAQKSKRTETSEELQARLKQHMAENRAKKAAAQAGQTLQAARVSPPSNAGSMEIETAASAVTQPMQMGTSYATNTQSMLLSPYYAMFKHQANGTLPMSPPFGQPPAMADYLTYNQYGYNAHAFTPNPMSHDYYGVPMQGVQPSNGPMYSLQTTPNSMTYPQASSPPTFGNLPAPPGLPQRPTLVPNPTRSEMERMHAPGSSGGYGIPSNASTTPVPTLPHHAAAVFDSADAMAHVQNTVASTNTRTDQAVHNMATEKVKKEKGTRLVWAKPDRLQAMSYEEVQAEW